jgi:hypothetical protein
MRSVENRGRTMVSGAVRVEHVRGFGDAGYELLEFGGDPIERRGVRSARHIATVPSIAATIKVEVCSASRSVAPQSRSEAASIAVQL